LVNQRKTKIKIMPSKTSFIKNLEASLKKDFLSLFSLFTLLIVILSVFINIPLVFAANDGTFETTFNNGAGAGVDGEVYTTKIQSDGKILIGGAFTQVGGIARNSLARLNIDGTLDTTFDYGIGPINNYSGGIPNKINAIEILPNGHIIVGGNFSTWNSSNDISNNSIAGTSKYLARLSSTGTFLNFNDPVNNIVYMGLTSDVYGVKLENNKIMVHGAADWERFNLNGSIDATFDGLELFVNNGIGSICNPTNGLVVRRLASGKYIMPMNINANLHRIVRCNANGSIDTTFSTANGANNFIRDIDIQPDGKMIITGDFTAYNGVTRHNIARLNADGTLDTSFELSSINFANIEFNQLNNFITNSTIQPDGKILIGGIFGFFGQIGQGGKGLGRIGRLNADGTLDSTFNTAVGFQGTGLVSVNDINLQQNGQLIVAGNFQGFLDSPFVSGQPIIQTQGIIRLNNEVSYTLTYISGPNGSLAGDLNQVVPASGNGTEVFVAADPGYIFTGWSDGSNATIRQDLNVTQSIVVTANFELDRKINNNPTNLTLQEGTSGTSDVNLIGQPTTNVTVNLTSTDPALFSVSPSSLTFTPANYATPQTITVTALQDPDFLWDNGYVVATIEPGGDTGWNAYGPANIVAVSVEDDEIPPAFGTPTGQVTGVLGDNFPTITLSGGSIPDNTDAWFVSGPSQVNGKMINNNFVPNNGTKIPLTFTVGPANGFLNSNSISSILISTNFTLPTIPAPTINFPAILTNTTFSNLPYTASGTCDSALTTRVDVLIGGNTYNSDCTNNAYSVDISQTNFSNGTYAIEAIARNIPLNLVSDVTSRNFDVDILTNIQFTSNGEFFGTPTFTGICEEDGTIQFYIDGSVISSFNTTCADDGTFSVSPNLSLNYYQSYSLMGEITDLNGNTAQSNTSFLLKHALPTIDEVNTLTIDKVSRRSLDSAIVTMRGKAYPGDLIVIGVSGGSIAPFVFDCTESFSGNLQNCVSQVTTTADSNGDWEYTHNFNSTFNGPNTYDLQIASLDSNGNASTDYLPYLMEITSNAFPTKPTIETAQPTVLTNPVFSGSCQAGTTIIVTLVTTSEDLASVLCDSNGSYSSTYTGNLVAEQYYQVVAKSILQSTGGSTNSDFYYFNTVIPKIGTSTQPISGIRGQLFPAILISGSTMSQGDSLSFTPAGTSTVITGKYRSNAFIPDPGQIIPTNATIGAAVGVLSASGLPNLNVNTNFSDLNTSSNTPLSVSLNQSSAQVDPSTSSPVSFTAVFSEAIDLASFTASDVVISGTAPGAAIASISEIAPNNGTTFQVTVSTTGDGIVTVNIPTAAYTYTSAAFVSISSVITANTPTALVKSPNGLFYVASSGSRTVHSFSATGTTFVAAFPAGFNPVAIALDSAQNIYTANSNGSVIKIYPGGHRETFSGVGTSPSGIVVDMSGNMFVSNSGSNNVAKITPSGAISTLGSTGAQPKAMVMDSTGNVYTANSGSNDVSKITPAGVSSILGTTGTNPIAITIDSSGNIYTANSGSNDVSKITPAGTSSILGTTGNTPSGISLDVYGNVYTTNRLSNNVSKIAPAGTSSIIGATGLSPLGVLVDTDGRIYVANSGSITIHRLIPTFSAGIKTTANKSNIASTSSDNSVTITSNNAAIVVTETGGNTTQPELGTDSFAVKLSQAPTSNVILTVSSGNTNAVAINPTTLTFTPTNWNTDQVVTVTGVKDSNIVSDSSVVTIQVNTGSSDSLYTNTSPKQVTAVTTDLDSAGWQITPVIDRLLNEGQTITNAYSVVLTAQPLQNVVIDVSTVSTSVTINTSSLTFTPTNWNTPQQISITGAEDANNVDEQDQLVTFAINTLSSDDSFDVLGPQTRQVDLVDNDVLLQYVAGTGGVITGLSSQLITSGTSGTSVTATPSLGYSFVNWSDGNTNTTRTDSNINSNRTITANFVLTPLSATINQANGQADPSLSPNLNFTLVFSEAIIPTSLTSSDFTLSGTGSGTVGTPTSLDNITWNIPVTGTSDGTIIASLQANSVTGSTFSNTNTASTSTDNSITYGPDTTPPTVTINSFTSPTRDTTVSFSGTAMDDVGIATVTISIDGNNFTPAFTYPNWTYTTDPLSNGNHTIRVRAVDTSTNQATTTIQNFVIDTTVPAPTVDVPNLTSDNTPTISGSCESNATVTIIIAPTNQNIITNCVNSSYSVTPTTIPDGNYSATANQTDSFNNVSATANDSGIIDTTQPQTPAITNPANGANLNTNIVTILGTGEPSATLVLKNQSNTTICTTTVGSDSNWACNDIQFVDGNHTISATQTDQAGNVSNALSGFTITTNDGDGVSPQMEDGAPNNGDGNNDGIADKFQSNVASLLNSISNQYNNLELTGSCDEIQSMAISTTTVNQTEQNVSFPNGLLDFTANCANQGESVQVELIYMGNYDLASSELRKFDGTIFETLSDAQKELISIGGQSGIKFTYTIVDGGKNDQDNIANGIIVDPIGLAIVSQTQIIPETIVNQIPTILSQTLIRTGGTLPKELMLITLWLLLSIPTTIVSLKKLKK
jgi:uncharacterized delta-60 repeat protein